MVAVAVVVEVARKKRRGKNEKHGGIFRRVSGAGVRARARARNVSQGSKFSADFSQGNYNFPSRKERLRDANASVH